MKNYVKPLVRIISLETEVILTSQPDEWSGWY